MQNYQNVVIDTAGNAVASYAITVKDAGTANVSTIYSDNGSTPLANPLSTDSGGTFTFWAADATYDLYHGTTLLVASALLFDPYAANAADTALSVRAITATVTAKVPTVAPGAPAAGHVWEDTGVLKHGASSLGVVDLSGNQTIAGVKTFSSTITSNLATGTSPLTVSSTTEVANLRAATATALATGSTLTLAQTPIGTANQILGTNAAGTVAEQKSLVLGTAGTDAALVHTANTVTLNLPTASGVNRGLLAAADWTTFNGGGITLARLPVGTANQLLGANAGATAVEQKSLATGTAGTDFGIVHTLNTITLNLPTADATHRGLLASADWTTFNSGNMTLARLPYGTANQILGTNAAATAEEQKTLAVGTAGTDFAIVHTANTVTFNIPDAGASARGAVTTGTQTFAGAKTLSGILAPTGGLACTGRSIYTTVPIGSVAYGSFGAAVNPVAGTIYITEIFIPRNVTLTGIGILKAGTVGTNKVNVALFTSAGGATVANSVLTGTALLGANTFQQIPFTGTYAAVGPARYWIAVQADGATDNIRMIAASTFVDVLTKSYAGAFGTISALTPPTTFTPSVGPISYVYA